MLGHEITFEYCRAPGAASPCRRILDCWFECFDVVEFMKAHFSREVIRQIEAPPRAKVLSLLELIEQAKRRAAD